MSLTLSPVAPARVQALLLPVGKVQKSRFRSHADRLRRDTVVRLGDISPDAPSDKTMFSPLAFPNGVILFNLTTTLSPDAHLSLSPYETFRAPLLILGVADATEESTSPDNLARLQQQLHGFVKTLSGCVASHLLVFDSPTEVAKPKNTPNLSLVPSVTQAKSTTIKTIMCDVSASFLAELTTLARSVQDAHVIDTPGTGAAPPKPFADLLYGHGADLSRQNSFPDARAGTPSSQLHQTNGDIGDTESVRSGSHPSSPGNDNQSPMSLTAPSTLERPQSSSHSRFSAFRRDSSRDRRSTPVVPVTVTERARNKLKARQTIVVGTLYLQAGRWSDALRELTEGAARAKSISDHVWHAKGLENILCTMILMAWGGVEFTVPSICYTTAEKPQARPRALTGGKDTSEIASEIQAKGLQTLSTLIPDLTRMISDIYPRAVHFQGESLTPFPLAQTNVRLAYLLSVLHRSGGSLNVDGAQLLVSGSNKLPLQAPTSSGTPSHITKQDIASILFRAYPNQSAGNELSMLEVAMILSGMSSVLAFAGLRRKQGLLMKELLSMLIPGLIQARKVGAAEVGIHPAASLAALHGLNNDTNNDFASVSNGDLELGFHSILQNLANTYGILLAQPRSGDKIASDVGDEELRNKRIMHAAEMKSFGSANLKSDILRLCSNFSEALPNFKDVVYYAGTLLDAAGPKGMHTPHSSAQRVRLSREEQIRLSSKISRTLSVVRSADVAKLETDYWDPFLVRDITLSNAADADLVVSHPSHSFSQGVGEPDAQIPKPREASIEQVAVVGDRSKILVTLQNPFEFEVIIERIGLIYEGAALQQAPQSLVLGPARTQIFSLTAIASEPGQLKISGCRIKIQGCREQIFPIFRSSWSPESSEKVKASGLAALPANTIGFGSLNATIAAQHPKVRGPTAEVCKLNVIDAQPLLTSSSDSLSQSIITVLEGQRRAFTITVRNVSESVPVTFVKVSFLHALRESQMETSKGMLGRTELYELDHLQQHHQPFRSEQSNGVKCLIKPGHSWSFAVDVFGRAGVTSGTVVIDYTQWDPETPTPPARIYTRTLSLPFSVTVQPSIALQRVDVMPLTQTLPSDHHLTPGTPERKPTTSTTDLVNYVEQSSASLTADSAKSYLLLLDLKNASEEPLSVSATANPSISPNPTPNWTISHASPYTSTAIIQPSRVARLVVPLPQLLVSNPAQPVPKLLTLKERQFVVSASGGPSAADERRTLELFWYRQALLSMLRGAWHTTDGLDLSGAIDLRGVRLTHAMLDVMRLHAVRVGFSLAADTDAGDSDALEAAPGAPLALKTTAFATLTAVLTNASARPLTFKLLLRPAVTHSGVSAFAAAAAAAAASGSGAEAAAPDATKNFVWSGTLLRAVVGLAPGESVRHAVGVCVLSSGRYVVEGTVVEIGRPGGEGVSGALLGEGRCEVVVSD